MAAGGRPPSLWERVCAEYEAEQPQFPDVPESKHGSVSLEAGILQPLRMEQFYSAPAADTVVQQLLPIPEAAPFPEPPDPKTCSPREYLEYYIFPVLLPGMAELLHRAKKEKCFERKRTKFIACDFLTEWLYNKNPKRKDESFTEFFSIPFVNDWLKDQIYEYVKRQYAKKCWSNFDGKHPYPNCLDGIIKKEVKSVAANLRGEVCWPQLPLQLTSLSVLRWPIGVILHGPRPPIPLSLLLSEEEASIVIQSFWRGYRVRCDSEIQELRQWQKQLREDKNIVKRVKEFWTKQEAKVGSKLEDAEEHTQNHPTSRF